jgi:heme/copper-type cytochrome/quinol oxidase subunit 4
MYKKDNFNTGFLVSLLEIFLVMIIVAGIYGSKNGSFGFEYPGKSTMLAIIPGAVNVWYFFKRKKENSGRGALIATFIAAISIFILLGRI